MQRTTDKLGLMCFAEDPAGSDDASRWGLISPSHSQGDRCHLSFYHAAHSRISH